MNEYTFSFYYKAKDKKIVYPKWWQFWKKAKLVEFEYWDRKVATINMDNYKFLESFEVQNLLQVLFMDIMYMQLEEASQQTSYVHTDGSIIEPAQTNLLKNTE
jgi:hypothetical protein